MLGFVRNTAALAESRDIAPRALAATYARLRLAERAHRYPRRARILDWEVAYADFGALVELFEEIFLRRHYPFRPRREAPFVVDCGANVGLATLYFKTLAPQAEVLAFEPEPTAFRLLAENVGANGIASIDCRPCAVAAIAGRVPLRVPAPAHGGASLEFSGPGWEEREVDAVRLSDCLGDRHVDFLKLDVEGSEGGVLAELGQAGALEQIDEIALEHHPRGAEALPDLLRIIAGAGFDYRIALAGDAFWDPGQLLLVHAFREPAHGTRGGAAG